MVWGNLLTMTSGVTNAAVYVPRTRASLSTFEIMQAAMTAATLSTNRTAAPVPPNAGEPWSFNRHLGLRFSIDRRATG